MVPLFAGTVYSDINCACLHLLTRQKTVCFWVILASVHLRNRLVLNSQISEVI